MNPLKYVRESKGISQMKLAQLSGISNTEICKIEKGWRELRPEQAEKLAEVLGVKTREILKE